MTPDEIQAEINKRLPEPDLFAHEIINDGGGIFIGCKEKGVCEQSHVPSETSETVYAFYSAETVMNILHTLVLERNLANKQINFLNKDRDYWMKRAVDLMLKY